MKKLLVVGVIGLFLGLACAPSINANVSKENELVEITTEICGLGGGKNTVQLSKEEAEEVERLIDDIERRLDEIETREETIEIFNDAIVELDKYGLLGGLSIEQAQILVTGKINDILTSTNNLCLVIGKTSHTSFFGPILTLFNQLINKLNKKLPRLFEYFYDYYTFFMTFYHIFTTCNPVNIIGLGHTVSIGKFIRDEVSCNKKRPSLGWIITIGAEGVRNWTGPMDGDLNISHFEDSLGLGGTHYYPGLLSFNGIKINLDIIEDKWFYLGTSLRVKIDEI